MTIPMMSTRIQEAVHRALQERRIVGAVVLVAHNGEVIHEQAAGLADRESDRVRAASPESNDTWRWGGAYGHSWFVDPVQRLSVVTFTNTLYEGMSGRFVTELRDAVYNDQESTQ